jgi:Domain of unknown function (DUF4129)
MSDRRRLAEALPGPAVTLGLLSLVLGLVAVVALASGGGRTGGGITEPREPSTRFWDYLFTMSVLVAIAGFAVSIFLLKQQLGTKGQMNRKGYHLLLFVFLASLVLGVFVAAQITRGDGNALRERGGGAVDGGSARDRFGPRKDGDGGASFLWGPALAVGAAGVVALAYLRAQRRVRRRDEDEASDEALADELAALLDATLDDLRAEPDPRRAVIAAYARMERALGAYGLPRHPFEAPLEFLERVSPELAELHAGGLRLVFELTHLFERAKFSHHAVDEEMKADAISSLEALRDDLRGGRG